MTGPSGQRREAYEHAHRLAEVERRLRALESNSQLGHSSISDGALRATVDGVTTLLIGKQFDGTNGANTLTGPDPGQPSQPAVVSVPGGFVITWDGQYVLPTFVAPMDFARVTVHVVDDLIGFDPVGTDLPSGIISSATGGRVFVAAPGGATKEIVLVAWTHAGKVSPPSVATSETAGPSTAPESVGTAELADEAVTEPKVSGALKPSGSAAASDEALRALGTSGDDAAAGDDARIVNAWHRAVDGRLPPLSVSPGAWSAVTTYGFNTLGVGTTPCTVEWQADVREGTWRLDVLVFKLNNTGIFDLDYSLDNGGTWTPFATAYDSYAAVTAAVTLSATGIAVTTETKILVRLVTSGTKNGSSTAYYAAIAALQLLRTA